MTAVTTPTNGIGHLAGWEPVAGRPAYRQVADQLRATIATGHLAPGDRLPPETALAGVFGVSLRTARAGLGMLRRQGLITTHPGAGSRVRPPIASEFTLARPLLLHPDHVTLVTLADHSRWLTDAYAAANLTALGLAEGFADLADGDYLLPAAHSPRPLTADQLPTGCARDLVGVVKALERYHHTATPREPVSPTPWALTSGSDTRRFLQVGAGVLVTVSGRLWERWDDTLRDIIGWVGWEITGGYTVHAQPRNTGWVLRWVLPDPDRTAGIMLGSHPRDPIGLPRLPAALVALAGTTPTPPRRDPQGVGA